MKLRSASMKLSDPRYEEIVITAGKKTVLKETMTALPPAKPPFGKLRTENPDHFAEFSNFAQALLLNPGTYEVKIVPLNGSPVTKAVTIEADKTVIVK
jgi:hypothetical protein